MDSQERTTAARGEGELDRREWALYATWKGHPKMGRYKPGRYSVDGAQSLVGWRRGGGGREQDTSHLSGVPLKSHLVWNQYGPGPSSGDDHSGAHGQWGSERHTNCTVWTACLPKPMPCPRTVNLFSHYLLLLLPLPPRDHADNPSRSEATAC